MARPTMKLGAAQPAALEPLYIVDPDTGLIIEVFYCDPVLAKSFDATNPGWFWWTCRHGCLPQVPPRGPFVTNYRAYCNAMLRGSHPTPFDKKNATRP